MGEKMVEVELLADGIRLKDAEGVARDYRKEDKITLPEGHAEVLRRHGSVAPVGTLKKLRQADADRAALDEERQRLLTGTGTFAESAAAEKTANESGAAADKAREEAAKPRPVARSGGR